ncbi:hypothetical protein [Pseudalkalibacillus sp. SCS-8]|uniref:hypothetical protein n=1 Tax=Pseudalkalibacillus nanhaiensis TaxID=3115291 RepID=UPI0032DB526D
MALISLVVVGTSSFIGIYVLSEADEGPLTLGEARQNGSVRLVANESLLVNERKEEELMREVHAMHMYWNELLGWGAWKTFKPSEKKDALESKMKYIRTILVPETQGSLKKDLNRAADMIEEALKEDHTEKLRTTHRIFHDLDVVMNDIVVDVVWGVTETYGKQ